MALTTAVHDSLPYIDPEPTPAQRSAAQALIDTELQVPSSPDPSQDPSHPSLPPITPPSFSPAISLELERIGSSTSLTAIDLTRYESSTTSTTPTQEALQRAQIAHTYLTLRSRDLSLLERFGKNAWLISNSQTEDVLRSLEQELEETKREIDTLVVERRNAQQAVRGEIESLGSAWRRGVGRTIETEAAAEGVRREVLRGRREGVLG